MKVFTVLWVNISILTRKSIKNVAKAMDDKWNKMQSVSMKDGYILNKFLGGNLGLNLKLTNII